MAFSLLRFKFETWNEKMNQKIETKYLQLLAKTNKQNIKLKNSKQISRIASFLVAEGLVNRWKLLDQFNTSVSTNQSISSMKLSAKSKRYQSIRRTQTMAKGKNFTRLLCLNSNGISGNSGKFVAKFK